MTIQLSHRERILHRIVIWSYLGLSLSYFAGALLLRGKPESFWRWLDFSKYLGGACLGLQLAALVSVIRRSGIVPAILMLIGGVAFIGFIIFPRLWLLLLSIAMSIASGVWIAWPQIRDLFQRMASSYREIAESNKM